MLSSVYKMASAVCSVLCHLQCVLLFVCLVCYCRDREGRSPCCVFRHFCEDCFSFSSHALFFHQVFISNIDDYILSFLRVFYKLYIMSEHAVFISVNCHFCLVDH